MDEKSIGYTNFDKFFCSVTIVVRLKKKKE